MGSAEKYVGDNWIRGWVVREAADKTDMSRKYESDIGLVHGYEKMLTT